VFGINDIDRHDYVRLDPAKVNITRRSQKATWFKLVSVRLGNATADYPNGDEVQTVEAWAPPDTWADLPTGAVGGKETGQRVTHYIIPGGPFVQSYHQLAARGWRLNLQSAPRPGGTRAPNSKVKSTCPVCGGNAWGKPNYELVCGPCLRALYPYIDLSKVAMMPEVQSYERDAAVVPICVDDQFSMTHQ
jgi:hypothetical protein